MQNWYHEHEITIADMMAIADDPKLPWERLSGKKILLTGGTGQIGQAMTKTIIYGAEKNGIDIQIYVSSRTKNNIEKAFKDYLRDQRVHPIIWDISKTFEGEISFDYIIHTASVTKSSDFVEKPVETLFSMVNSTKNVLELAKQREGCEVLYVSSMEVYGTINKNPVSENDAGVLQHLNLRSSYPEGKKCCELLSLSYHAEYGIPVKIVRPTLTFGGKLLDTDTRVYAQFVRSVLNKKDIILHTKGTTERDYLYLYDCVHAILSVLLLGGDGEVYNLSNPDTYCSILDMAKLAQSFAPSINIVFDISPENNAKYLHEVRIRLDTSKLDTLNNFSKSSLYDIFLKVIELNNNK